MKKSVTLLAALFLTLGSVACSHKPAREEAPVQSQASGFETPVDGTVSGAPTSLGAPSSGRGH